MKVKFVPQNVEFEIKPGESVMHLAQDNGLYVKSVCKGVPSCAECRVRVVENNHNVLPPGSDELGLIGTGHFIDGRRLSCQLKCFGDITVDMSEQIAKEQGLMGGRKSKTKAIKDDRIEDAHAIRASSLEESADDEIGPRPSGPRDSGSREPAARDSGQPRRGGPNQRRPTGRPVVAGAAPHAAGGAEGAAVARDAARDSARDAARGPGKEHSSQPGKTGRRKRRRGRGPQASGPSTNKT